ncbi:hypothetical protein [Tumebacillus lipolyticus]|uniref:Uncharacterized protein n=1 Tax=Tumebacillus lipolyticus TaxID=1280370 RepID=A0ABW4ZYG4_9BACL
MFKSLFREILGSKKHHRYSSSDYKKRHGYQKFSSSDYKKYGHGHKHYKRKHTSIGFFSS